LHSKTRAPVARRDSRGWPAARQLPAELEEAEMKGPQVARREMTAPPKQNSARADGRRSMSRQEIKSIALDLFHERGFKSVSVRDIMDQQGLTAGAMYNHFDSKEDLLYSIVLDSVEGIEHYVEEAQVVSGDSDTSTHLAALVFAHALFQCDQPQLARVVTLEMQHLPQGRRLEMRSRLQDVRDQFERVAIRGIEQGIFDVEYPDVVVMEFLGMGTKISDWYHQSGRLRPETIAELHAHLVLRMMGGQIDDRVFDALRTQFTKGLNRGR
jgi:TetR/AcrR family transcriptional regulator, cholesterol catabolism regulator